MVRLLSEAATVTSKSMVTIPVKIRQKYGIKEGMKVEFVELEDAVLMIPLRSLKELKGVDKAHETALKEAIRELNEEHRKEAGG
jgi:AbrB family looped-hinge helix DNA binding protein